MKRMVPPKKTTIPPVSLYWEDLSALVSLFNEYCETVEISDDKAIYDSLNEAKENVGTKIRNFEIVGKIPNVRLSLVGTGSWLTQQFDRREMTQAELDRVDTLFYRVKEFLDQRQRKESYYLGRPLVTLLGLVIIVWSFATIILRKLTSHTDAAFYVGWLVIIAWLSLTETYRTDIGVVSLKPKAEVTSFWERNRDAIKIAVLSGIGATLLDLLKTYLPKVETRRREDG
jgi:hypothetical protein